MTRHAALTAGVLALCAAWLVPFTGLVESPFVHHTIVHVAVISVAAPLIAFCLVAVQRPGVDSEPLLPPLPAGALGLVVVWIWHVPLLYGLARISETAWVLEQVSFLAAGMLLWVSVLRSLNGEAILALLMTSMHTVLLGTLLMLAPRPLYAHGIQTLADFYAHLAGQRLGGLLMLVGGGIPYLAAGLYLSARRMRRPVREARISPTGPWNGIDIAERSALDEGVNR